MASQGRTIDGARLEQLIDESDLSMVETGREFARLRLKRKPTEREAANARSQIQKLIRNDGGATPRTIRLLAEVLAVDQEAFLYPPPEPAAEVFQLAPVAIMQEALENQREMKARLESLGDVLANLAEGQAELLRRLPVQKAAQPKPASAESKRRR